MTEMRWKKLKVFCAASAAALAAAAVISPAPAAAQQCPEEDRGPSETLSARVGQELQRIYEELMNAERFQEARAALDQLLSQRGGSMSAFERATVLELRGSVKVQLEDFRGAQSDFQSALQTNALPQARSNQLRYFVSQLHFQLEDYQAAIRGLNEWIEYAQRCGVTVDPNAYYLLAAAYVQLEPPNYRGALPHAEKAKAGTPEPRKSFYDLLNLIYSELGEAAKRTSLLEEMINHWPAEKSYWTQLSGLYNNSGRDRDAFAVLEVAYRAGLLSSENELKTLIQYYSFFNNPYRGAEMLEREMNAGNIKRTQDNLVLLSQLWSQSREHKKSIPILREASRASSKGELAYRLGMVLLADEQYAAAEQALELALNKGGMDRDDTGDAWMLLGTARFSQAGPEDTAIWASARTAFVNAQRYEKARRQATEWISYIDAVRTTYEAQKRLERQQEIERCQAELQRLEQQERIRDLQNREPTREELEQAAKLREECKDLVAEAGG